MSRAITSNDFLQVEYPKANYFNNSNICYRNKNFGRKKTLFWFISRWKSRYNNCTKRYEKYENKCCRLNCVRLKEQCNLKNIELLILRKNNINYLFPLHVSFAKRLTVNEPLSISTIDIRPVSLISYKQVYFIYL